MCVSDLVAGTLTELLRRTSGRGGKDRASVEPVRVTSAGTLTGHDRLLFPPDVDSNTVCCVRPMPLDKQA